MDEYSIARNIVENYNNAPMIFSKIFKISLEHELQSRQFFRLPHRHIYTKNVCTT